MPCRIAIAIVGMPGSGKSTCIEAVVKAIDIDRISLGDVVREEATKRGVPLSKINEFANELRKELGPAAVAILARDKLVVSRDVCLIDGVRSLYEIEFFRKEMGIEVIVVAIHASPRKRFERLRNRGRPDDPRTWEEFEARDLRELSWGLGSVIALADYMIVNEGSLDELKSACIKVVTRVLEGRLSSIRGEEGSSP